MFARPERLPGIHFDYLFALFGGVIYPFGDDDEPARLDGRIIFFPLLVPIIRPDERAGQLERARVERAVFSQLFKALFQRVKLLVFRKAAHHAHDGIGAHRPFVHIIPNDVGIYQRSEVRAVVNAHAFASLFEQDVRDKFARRGSRFDSYLFDLFIHLFTYFGRCPSLSDSSNSLSSLSCFLSKFLGVSTLTVT